MQAQLIKADTAALSGASADGLVEWYFIVDHPD
jgi:hypothetical protein